MKRYPLQALHQIRQQAVEERELELGTSKKQTEEAAVAVNRAEKDELRERDEAKKALEQELMRAKQGAARASDFQGLQGFSFGHQARLNSLAQLTRSAEQGLASARQAEVDALHSLQRAEADEAAIAKHKDRFVKERKRAVEAAAEEEAAEVFNSRFGRSG